MAPQNGVDIKTVSSMLGHYDAGFTLRTYTHAMRLKQDEAAETMVPISLPKPLSISLHYKNFNPFKSKFKSRYGSMFFRFMSSKHHPYRRIAFSHACDIL